METVIKEKFELKESEVYPKFMIVPEERNRHDTQLTIQRMDSVAHRITNPEKITGKLLWYTTEGGYCYNHPYKLAKKRAELIVEALNKSPERRQLECFSLDLLEKAIRVREWYEKNRVEYFGEDTPICFSELLSSILKCTEKK